MINNNIIPLCTTNSLIDSESDMMSGDALDPIILAAKLQNIFKSESKEKQIVRDYSISESELLAESFSTSKAY